MKILVSLFALLSIGLGVTLMKTLAFSKSQESIIKEYEAYKKQSESTERQNEYLRDQVLKVSEALSSCQNSKLKNSR
jgi:cell division protein FtsB